MKVIVRSSVEFGHEEVIEADNLSMTFDRDLSLLVVTDEDSKMNIGVFPLRTVGSAVMVGRRAEDEE